MPSPIINGKQLLPFPIPSAGDTTRYDALTYQGKSYATILHELNNQFSAQTCHLDPDLIQEVLPGRNKSVAAFGQEGAAQRHLEKHNVQENDLFLFFGWFREAREIDGIYRFVENAPDLHVIYGYLQIGKFLKTREEMQAELPDHPHSTGTHKEPNCIYLPTRKLFGVENIPGAGMFPFQEDLILTERDKSKLPNERILRSRWKKDFLKDFLGIKTFSMTYHRNSFKDSFFQSVARGQEFIIEPTPKKEFSDSDLEGFKNRIISLINKR